MSSPLTRAEYLRLDFGRQLALQARLLPVRTPAVALLLAVGGGVAMALTGSWVVIVAVLAAVVVQQLLARRRQRAAGAAMLAIVSRRPDVSAWETGDLEALPAFMRDPEDTTSVEQLERLLLPTPDDRRAMVAAAPIAMAVPTLAALLAALGMLGLLVAVIAAALGVRDAPVLVPLVASIPLASLALDIFHTAEALRAAVLVAVDRAREQLPRLWQAAPNASSGVAIRSVGDGYVIDLSAVPGTRPTPLTSVPRWKAWPLLIGPVACVGFVSLVQYL